MRIDLGMPVECQDGPCGSLRDVVIDPLRRKLTHVVIEPRHRHLLARLVPVATIDRGASGSGLRLDCRAAELLRYPVIEETAYLRTWEVPQVDDDVWDVGVSSVLSPPPDLEADATPAWELPMSTDDRALVAYDRIPADEVEIEHGSPVDTTDASSVGRVEGLVVDGTGCVTHIVVDRGRYWGHRELTVPITAVKHIRTDRVELSSTRAEAEAMPSTRVHWRHP